MRLTVRGKGGIEVISHLHIALQILEQASMTAIVVVDYAKMLPWPLDLAGPGDCLTD